MKIAGLLTTAAVAAVLAGCEHAGNDALSVVVSLPRSDAANVAKATLLVDYSGTGARIVSEGGGPSCAFILPGIDGDFADDGKGTLTIHTLGARALHGPADIVACRMQPGSADVTAADIQAKLSVRVAGAEDAAGKAIDVAAKPGRGRAAAAGNRTEQNLQAQQAEAVRSAKAAAAANPPAAAGTPSATTGGAATTGGGAAKPATPGAGTGPAGAPAAAAKPPTSIPPPRPPASGAGSSVPSASSGPSGSAGANANDNGAVVSNQDRDPSYDDSPSNDANAPSYYVEIAVPGSGGRFGALQFEITHLGRSGGFIGHDDQVECVALVDAIVAANYIGERVAKIGMISLQGIRTGSSIVRCNFRTRESLSPASFLIEVTDASDTNSIALDPPPTVVVSSVARR